MGGMIGHLYRRKSLTPEQESEICRKCQWCCRWNCYRSPFNGTPKEHLDFMNEWGIPSAIEQDEKNGEVIRFFVPLPCQHIREGTGCAIYENRPVICRNHRGGDSDAGTIPYCGWYEAIPDDEKFKRMKGIEWGNTDKPGT